MKQMQSGVSASHDLHFNWLFPLVDTLESVEWGISIATCFLFHASTIKNVF